MRRELLWAITNLADSGLILPLCALLACVLYRESRHAAWLFVRALFVCLVIMTLIKLVFLSCGKVFGSNIHSPSGHASLASFFFGSLAVVLYARMTHPKRWLVLACAALMAVVIGATRIALSAHSPLEVIIGGTIGAFCLALFVVPYLHMPHKHLPVRNIALMILPVFLLCYGSALPAEKLLFRIADHLRPVICPAPGINAPT